MSSHPTDDHQQTTVAVRTLVASLVASLEACGLMAEVYGQSTVRVVNAERREDADPASPPRAGLRQAVRCDRQDDGSLWWFWVWDGVTRKSAPDLEPLCPAHEADKAAAQIAKVLGAESIKNHKAPTGNWRYW